MEIKSAAAAFKEASTFSMSGFVSNTGSAAVKAGASEGEASRTTKFAF
jgi:hypothetical protein